MNSELYHGLEPQRAAHREQMLDALRDNPAPALELRGWHRAVSYQYSLSPLSSVGSVRGPGGRFNVGEDLGAEGFVTWQALYLAETFETAFREKFQLSKGAQVDGLTPEELALTNADSFSDVRVAGFIGLVFDVGDRAALDAFAKIISRFKMPLKASILARRLGIPPNGIGLIRSAAKLQEVILESNWRRWPVQFDLPSQSQILGRLLLEAGYEAVVYPSTKNGARCVAVFPRNLTTQDSYVELDGTHPDEVKHPRLDAASAIALMSVA